MGYESVSYLKVKRSDVLDFTQLRNSLLDLFCQGSGREDSKSPGLQAHDCASSADFDQTVS